MWVMLVRLLAKFVKGQAKKEKLGTKSKKKGTSFLYVAFLMLIGGGALQVSMPLIDGVMDFFAPPGYSRLDASDPALAKVFFGGHPWILLCQNEAERTPDIWDVAAKLHSQSETPDAFNFGILDCAAALPSGKTTYQRFKLKPPVPREGSSIVPFHAVYCGNGEAPKLFGDVMLQQPGRPNHAMGQKFIDAVAARGRKSSRLINSGNDLRERCTKHKWCGVVLAPGKVEGENRKKLDAMMQAHRTVHWVTINTLKRELSTASKLPAIEGLSEEEAEGEPRLLMFQRKPREGTDSKGKKLSPKLAARAHRGRFSLEEVSPFLDELLNTTGTSTTETTILKKPPVIYKFGQSPKPTPKHTKKPVPPKASEGSQTKEEASGQRTLTPAEARKRQREREERRRAAMEREKREHAMGMEDDYGEAVEAEEEEEEDEEDVVNLDDDEEEEEEVEEAQDEEEAPVHDEI